MRLRLLLISCFIAVGCSYPIQQPKPQVPEPIYPIHIFGNPVTWEASPSWPVSTQMSGPITSKAGDRIAAVVNWTSSPVNGTAPTPTLSDDSGDSANTYRLALRFDDYYQTTTLFVFIGNLHSQASWVTATFPSIPSSTYVCITNVDLGFGLKGFVAGQPNVETPNVSQSVPFSAAASVTVPNIPGQAQLFGVFMTDYPADRFRTTSGTPIFMSTSSWSSQIAMGIETHRVGSGVANTRWTVTGGFGSEYAIGAVVLY